MRPNAPKLVYSFAICSALALAAGPAEGQGLLDRARDAARNTGIGRDLSRTAAEAQMLAADRIDLEDRGLATLSVGDLTFGVSAVEIREGAGVRVIGYLLNGSAQDALIAVPEPDLFVLVDAKGRRLERLGGVAIEGLAEGAAEVGVPALERVQLSLLFGTAAPGADVATLKVGTIGTIAGIPVRAEPGSPAGSRGATVWDAAAHSTPDPASSEPASPDEPVQIAQ